MSKTTAQPDHIELLLTNNPRRLAYTAPLHMLLADSFDYKAFSKAIKAETRLSDDQKKHVLATFDPKARVTMSAGSPVSGIGAHIQMGASPDMPSPRTNNASAWAPENRELLAPDHPITEMWREVWQKTLEHYAAEATEYDQIMTAKGMPMLEDPSGYPALPPSISLMKGSHFINAAATLSPEGKSAAVVTEGFLDKLSPEEQRAILFHEAQHAFEPVLEGKTPKQFMMESALTGLATSHYTTRQKEVRADEHAARMGCAQDMVSGFENMESQGAKEFFYQATVMRHLDDAGFAINAAGVKNVLVNAVTANQELLGKRENLKNLLDNLMKDGLVDEVAAQEFMGLGRLKDTVESIGKKVLTTANDIAAAISDNMLQAQVNSLNHSITAGATFDRASEAGLVRLRDSSEEREVKGIAGHLGKFAEKVQEARRSHPPTKDRIEHVKRVEPCKGCVDPSPFASHGDRVKAISKSGIQGIGAAR